MAMGQVRVLCRATVARIRTEMETETERAAAVITGMGSTATVKREGCSSRVEGWPAATRRPATAADLAEGTTTREDTQMATATINTGRLMHH